MICKNCESNEKELRAVADAVRIDANIISGEPAHYVTPNGAGFVKECDPCHVCGELTVYKAAVPMATPSEIAEAMVNMVYAQKLDAMKGVCDLGTYSDSLPWDTKGTLRTAYDIAKEII